MVALSHSYPDFLLCLLLLRWWAAVYNLGLAWPHPARTHPGICLSGLNPERFHPCYQLWHEGLQATEHLICAHSLVSSEHFAIETALLNTCANENAVLV